ncbi:spermatogenesis-associated serine-rich protein 1 [Suncus etruscus]|uniref:spermatogenesis-associated serine-rich protein 1 n=1 Tax=Suncus etruscus TaxID=109475 RepID=UPI00211066F3|nr:spermatogenesis-associated serine-rich protein 1 [Suncus etruscus]
MNPEKGTLSCHLPAISGVTCGHRELETTQETIREQGDPGLGAAERGTVHGDFLKSQDHFINTASSGRRIRVSPVVEMAVRDRHPLEACRKTVHFAPVSDLDWKSSSSSSHSSETSLPAIQKDQYPEEITLLNLLTKDGQRPEWTFYPRFSSNVHTYHVGKQCFFNGTFLGNRRSLAESTVDKSLGKKKYAIDPRNGIPKLTPGDNPYMNPEQSVDFHKAGSTLPPVNFSLVPYKKKLDTFIPLEPLPSTPVVPFWMKEKTKRLINEIKEVEELENWRPATPVLQSICHSGFSGSLDNSRQF